jgi:hypothetical protein
MRMLFTLTGLMALGLIFWAGLGYLMDLDTFPLALTLAITGILAFLVIGVLKNQAEQRRFREFLESQNRDREVQEKRKNESVRPGDRTGRAKVKAEYRERNTGVNWTGASVHGATPHRKQRRTFLSKNR